MAKKKSKKNEKLRENLNDQSELNPTSNGLGKAGTAAVGVLVGEIMVIAIERVIERLSKNYQSNHAQDENTLLTLALSGLQDSLQAFQRPVQKVASDVEETTKSVAGDLPGETADTITAVKDDLSNAIAQPVHAAKTTANVAVGELFDAAKTAVSAISTLSSEKHKKKKHKK